MRPNKIASTRWISIEGNWRWKKMSARLPFSVFQYSSHLEFFQDAYDSLHARDESFSYEKIANLCGLKSRTEARNLIKGIKPATDAQILQLGSCLGLDDADER